MNEQMNEQTDGQISVLAEEQTETVTKVEKLPRYRVILWNDDDHTFEYVIFMMKKIFNYGIKQGSDIAMSVHKHGKTSVAVLPLEEAELRREQILHFGPDPLLSESLSSMYATLEPVEEND